MKTLPRILLLLLGLNLASAQTTPVLFTLQSLTGTVNNRSILVHPDRAQNPLVFGTNLLPTFDFTLQPSNGQILTNLVPWGYTITVSGWPRSAHIVVPFSTNVINAATLINTNQFSPLQIFQTPVLNGGSGITLVTNGDGSITISGGGGGTNSPNFTQVTNIASAASAAATNGLASGAFTAVGNVATLSSNQVVNMSTNALGALAYAANVNSNQVSGKLNQGQVYDVEAGSTATNSFDPINAAKNATNGLSTGAFTAVGNVATLSSNQVVNMSTNGLGALAYAANVNSNQVSGKLNQGQVYDVEAGSTATNSFDPINAAKNATNGLSTGAFTAVGNAATLSSNQVVNMSTNALGALAYASNVNSNQVSGQINIGQIYGAAAGGGNANTNVAQTWTSPQQFTNTGNNFSGNAAGLTNPTTLGSLTPFSLLSYYDFLNWITNNAIPNAAVVTNVTSVAASTNVIGTDPSGHEVAIPWASLPSGGASTLNTLQTNASGLAKAANFTAAQVVNTPSVVVGNLWITNNGSFYLIGDVPDASQGEVLALDLVNGRILTGAYSSGVLATNNILDDGSGNATLKGLTVTNSKITIAQFSGNNANYAEINVQNFNPAGSSDITATGDNGTPGTNYMNMGHNGSGYVPGTGILGSTNDNYLESVGASLLYDIVGPYSQIWTSRSTTNGAVGTNMFLNNSGLTVNNNANFNSNVVVSGSLTVSGSITGAFSATIIGPLVLTNNFTGSNAMATTGFTLGTNGSLNINSALQTPVNITGSTNTTMTGISILNTNYPQQAGSAILLGSTLTGQTNYVLYLYQGNGGPNSTLWPGKSNFTNLCGLYELGNFTNWISGSPTPQILMAFDVEQTNSAIGWTVGNAGTETNMTLSQQGLSLFFGTNVAPSFSLIGSPVMMGTLSSNYALGDINKTLSGEVLVLTTNGQIMVGGASGGVFAMTNAVLDNGVGASLFKTLYAGVVNATNGVFTNLWTSALTVTGSALTNNATFGEKLGYGNGTWNIFTNGAGSFLGFTNQYNMPLVLGTNGTATNRNTVYFPTNTAPWSMTTNFLITGQLTGTTTPGQRGWVYADVTCTNACYVVISNITTKFFRVAQQGANATNTYEIGLPTNPGDIVQITNIVGNANILMNTNFFLGL